jgi:hypothetical protein
MVIGVFWTRLGTPTGDAESGTVVEIDRAGNAGKPVMLYFSKAKVELDEVDLVEYQRLKDFKNRTYPRGLVETYGSIAEFRTKLARQLGSQIRDTIRETARRAAETPGSSMSMSACERRK